MLIEFVVNWLVFNCGSGGWSNMCDIVFVVLVLLCFLVVSCEVELDVVVEVVVNGKMVKCVMLDCVVLLEGLVVLLEVLLFKVGKNKVELWCVGGCLLVYGLVLVFVWVMGDVVKLVGYLFEVVWVFDW